MSAVRYQVLTTPPSAGYELLDSGESEKLERYGDIVLARPDPQALWPKRDAARWGAARAVFARRGMHGAWRIAPDVPKRWAIAFGGLEFWIAPTAFKHTGLFPEQESNWSWIRERITRAERPTSILNLFGYTGGATLAAAAAGARVCHVDGSTVAIRWARDNAERSGLGDRPVRWILDDARAFLKREVKRGVRYDGIILDPPALGHGSGGERWVIAEDLLGLLDLCRAVLTDHPICFLINGYASGYSALAYGNNLTPLVARHGGTVEVGELTIAESGDGARLLPAGIFARWRA